MRERRGVGHRQVMDGLRSNDGFWYFQPWLIWQGQDWYEHAVRDPDNLAVVPGVRVHGHLADCEDSIYDALAERGREAPLCPSPPVGPGTSMTGPRSSATCHGSRRRSLARSISRTEQPAAAELPTSIQQHSEGRTVQTYARRT